MRRGRRRSVGGWGALAILATVTLMAAPSPAGANAVRQYLTSWNTPPGSNPFPQAVDSEGNVYVYNLGTKSVSKYDSEGNPVNFSALGTNTIDGKGPTNDCPNVPTDCDRVPYGQLLLPSGFLADRVPTVAVDTTNGPATGYIYVMNAGTGAYGEGDQNTNVPNARIEVFAPSGHWLGQINTNTDFPNHINNVPSAVNVDQKGAIYVWNYGGTMDKFVPVDGDPSHDVFVGQLRPRVPLPPPNVNEYVTVPQSAVGGDPYSYALIPGALPPSFPDGPLYVYDQEQFLVVDRNNPGLGSDWVHFTFRPIGVGADVEGNLNWQAVTLDPLTGHFFVVSSNRIQEWDSAGNQIGPIFGPGQVAGTSTGVERFAFDTTNLPTRGRFYAKGSENNGDSVAVFSAPLPTPEIVYGDRSVGHDSAHIEARVELAGGPEVTECKLEWGTTFKISQGLQEAKAPLYERSPVPCDVAPPYTEDTEVTFDLSNLPTEQEIHFRVAATNEHGVSLGKSQTIHPFAVKGLQTGAATGITKNSAVLNASLDPDGMDTTYFFEYGVSTKYGSRTEGASAGAGTGQQAVPGIEVTKLHPGTRYHYRVVAVNILGTTYGEDRTFTSGSPPRIAAFRATNLAETSADLHAEINPAGLPTEYHFEYGTTANYGQSTPERELAPGEDNVSVAEHIENLQPGVTYHYRVVATNDLGTTRGEDSTFDFFPPSCPNALVRQQTSANYLPDCRAYELVSPRQAGATYIVPSDTVFDWGHRFGGGALLDAKQVPLNTGLAASPSRYAFFGALAALSGFNTPNISSDMYLSTRTTDGWDITYPGPSADEMLMTGRRQCSIAMDRCLSRKSVSAFPEEAEKEGEHPEEFARLYDVSGGSLGNLPTNVDAVPNGRRFRGESRASPDFSHFVFVSVNVPFAVGGLAEPPGSVYDNDVEADTVELISRLPNGEHLPQDPISAGNPDDYLDIPFVSVDGSRVLMGIRTQPRCQSYKERYCRPECLPNCSPDPNPEITLYMRAKGVTYAVSRDKRVQLHDVARDGAQVFFTSPESFVPGDTDESDDLYRWDEATDSISLVSVGTNGPSNDDSCSVEWTDGCGVVPLRNCSYISAADPCESRPWGFPTERPDIDMGTARATGATLFYSPEQLDAENPGVAEERNLYLAVDGKVQHVATFDPGTEATRYNITPDGKHVAFVTAARLTSYDNVAPSNANCQEIDSGPGLPDVPCFEMYRFDADTGVLRCVSCNPSGAKPRGDAIASAGGRFMSDDGRVFFSTRDALVPRDTDGGYSVYEYVDGRPQLISSGRSAADRSPGLMNVVGLGDYWDSVYVGLEAVSADGVDVYFTTFDTLVPEDNNGQFVKIYDARTNGGFVRGVPALSCEAADECHGPTSSAPAEIEVGSSADLAGSGNLRSAQRKGRRAKQRAKRRARRRRAHRRRARQRARRARAGAERRARHG